MDFRSSYLFIIIETVVFCIASISVNAQGFRGEPLIIDYDDYSGFTKIFDGDSFDNWKGMTDTVWRVEDSTIVGELPEDTGGAKSFLYFQEDREDAMVSDFELKVEIKLDEDNSGVHYRSRSVPAQDWGDETNTGGYQMDFAEGGYGQFYEGYGRGVTTRMGQVVLLEPNEERTLVSTVGGSNEDLNSVINVGEWNQMHLIARGNTFIHIINGRVMSITIDDDPQNFVAEGILALQVEGSGAARVAFRNIYLKEL